jgi:hypothetical protein
VVIRSGDEWLACLNALRHRLVEVDRNDYAGIAAFRRANL